MAKNRKEKKPKGNKANSIKNAKRIAKNFELIKKFNK